MIEQAAAHSVDLDADCLLHGQLELIFWFPPQTVTELFSLGTLELLPRQTFASFGVFLLSLLFVISFFKELKITTFDPALANALGFSSSKMHYALMILVAISVVASFEAVGSILVIAMIICPAATARLLTDKLKSQLIISAIVATLTTIGGYSLAATAPTWLGTSQSLNAAGTMAVFAGILLTSAVFLAPQYGLIGKSLRRLILSTKVTRDDILGILYRLEEKPSVGGLDRPSKKQIVETAPSKTLAAIALRLALHQKDLIEDQEGLSLTSKGNIQAQNLVRHHRLWESYLVSALGLAPDHVHNTAMQLEHFTSQSMATKLAEDQNFPLVDPHKKPIPEAIGQSSKNKKK
jgi:manganese/zinc/iron transport system permease protein